MPEVPIYRLVVFTGKDIDMKRKKPGRTLFDYLERVPDKRSAQGRRFHLSSVLGLVVGAVLCGRRDLAGIARWAAGLRKEPDLLRRLGIERSDTPCHATFHNVLANLDIKALGQMFWAWTKGLVRAGVMDEVALDGKTLRGSRSGGYAGLHLVTAYCGRMKGVVSQMRVEPGMNEVTAALRMLKGIPLDGKIVTGDAMYANRRLCTEIITRGAEYAFLVKEDKPQLLEDIQLALSPAFSPLRREKAPA